MPSALSYVNAWLELDEDQPDSVGYKNPGSAFQRLITGGVYRAVDTLLVGFLNTVPLAPAPCRAVMVTVSPLQMALPRTPTVSRMRITWVSSSAMPARPTQTSGSW